MSLKATKSPLPYGWVVKTSSTCPDKIYYFNIKTGCRTSKCPELVPKSLSNASKERALKKNNLSRSSDTETKGTGKLSVGIHAPEESQGSAKPSNDHNNKWKSQKRPFEEDLNSPREDFFKHLRPPTVITNPVILEQENKSSTMISPQGSILQKNQIEIPEAVVTKSNQNSIEEPQHKNNQEKEKSPKDSFTASPELPPDPYKATISAVVNRLFADLVDVVHSDICTDSLMAVGAKIIDDWWNDHFNVYEKELALKKNNLSMGSDTETKSTGKLSVSVLTPKEGQGSAKPSNVWKSQKRPFEADLISPREDICKVLKPSTTTINPVILEQKNKFSTMVSPQGKKGIEKEKSPKDSFTASPELPPDLYEATISAVVNRLVDVVRSDIYTDTLMAVGSKIIDDWWNDHFNVYEKWVLKAPSCAQLNEISEGQIGQTHPHPPPMADDKCVSHDLPHDTEPGHQTLPKDHPAADKNTPYCAHPFHPFPYPPFHRRSENFFNSQEIVKGLFSTNVCSSSCQHKGVTSIQSEELNSVEAHQSNCEGQIGQTHPHPPPMADDKCVSHDLPHDTEPGHQTLPKDHPAADKNTPHCAPPFPYPPYPPFHRRSDNFHRRSENFFNSLEDVNVCSSSCQHKGVTSIQSEELNSVEAHQSNCEGQIGQTHPHPPPMADDKCVSHDLPHDTEPGHQTLPKDHPAADKNTPHCAPPFHHRSDNFHRRSENFFNSLEDVNVCSSSCQHKGVTSIQSEELNSVEAHQSNCEGQIGQTHPHPPPMADDKCVSHDLPHDTEPGHQTLPKDHPAADKNTPHCAPPFPYPPFHHRSDNFHRRSENFFNSLEDVNVCSSSCQHKGVTSIQSEELNSVEAHQSNCAEGSWERTVQQQQPSGSATLQQQQPSGSAVNPHQDIHVNDPRIKRNLSLCLVPCRSIPRQPFLGILPPFAKLLQLQPSGSDVNPHQDIHVTDPRIKRNLSLSLGSGRSIPRQPFLGILPPFVTKSRYQFDPPPPQEANQPSEIRRLEPLQNRAAEESSQMPSEGTENEMRRKYSSGV